MKKIFVFLLIVAVSSIFAINYKQKITVLTGADILVSEKLDLIKGKKIGLVVNHSSLLSNGKHLVDALYENKEIKIVALFGPEHGFRGDTTGEIDNTVDKKTGIPVFSLYGKTYKPTNEMLQGIEVLIFDIQDVGARFYTYISTLGHVMEAAAENNINVIVLDRPNPITGLYIDGPITDESFKSFVAYAPIPISHGLTVGELANMYNEKEWLNNKIKANLTVIKMKGWKRNLWYDETNLMWIKPSPNMPTINTAIVYPGTCLFEGTNVSEGRGTEKPFEYIGATWMNSKKIISELKKIKLQGVSFEANQFTPQWYSYNSKPPKYHNEKCNGIFVKVNNRNRFESVKTGIALIWAIKKNHPENFQWKEKTFDNLMGNNKIRKMIDEGKTPTEIFETWREELNQFKEMVRSFFLY